MSTEVIQKYQSISLTVCEHSGGALVIHTPREYNLINMLELHYQQIFKAPVPSAVISHSVVVARVPMAWWAWLSVALRCRGHPCSWTKISAPQRRLKTQSGG